MDLSHKTRQQAAQDVKEAADTVASRTAEMTSKGAAQRTTKIYDGKVGPEEQSIYIDNKGKRIFLKATESKDKE